MTHTEHDHHETPPGPSPFSDQEWARFQAEDRGAGAAVVGLMTGIFLIGLVLYIGVAVACWPIAHGG
jgi:hypothetical protein